MAKKYSPEFKDRAHWMMADHQWLEATSGWGAATAVGEKLEVSPRTLRTWAKQDRRDAHYEPGPTSSELDELKRLRREKAELKRANEILKTASTFFAAELERPATK